jgi:endonuclease/exonuclease/phosphatase (EEP) superfamily protein YafD
LVTAFAQCQHHDTTRLFVAGMVAKGKVNGIVSCAFSSSEPFRRVAEEMTTAGFGSVALRRGLSLMLAAGALAAIALGALGQWYAPLDIFAQFTAHWLILVGAAFVAAAFPRRAGAIVISAIPAAILTLPLITATYHDEAARPPMVRETNVAAAASLSLPTSAATSPGTADPLAASFKLLTFNLLQENRDYRAIIDEIERHDADIVFLAEYGSTKKLLQAWLSRRYPYNQDCSGSWHCSIALYSRFPIAKQRLVLAQHDAGPRRIHADIQIGGTNVHVIGTHLISPLYGRSANYRELDFLAREVAARGPGPVVVAGDFNATLFSNAFRNFVEKSGLVHMGHLIPSWPMSPVALPQIGIDHVFMSRDVELYDVAAGRAAGSDHLPIAATLRLRQ